MNVSIRTISHNREFVNVKQNTHSRKWYVTKSKQFREIWYHRPCVCSSSVLGVHQLQNQPEHPMGKKIIFKQANLIIFIQDICEMPH